MARTVKYTFNPFELTGRQRPKSKDDKDEALAAVADFVLEQVLDYVGRVNTPVKDAPFKKSLSKEYRKFKSREGYSSRPDLELSGDMLDALRTKVEGNRITLLISGKQGDKADGHNNHSGESRLPERRFIPKEEEVFKKPIMDGIKRIIDELNGN